MRLRTVHPLVRRCLRLCFEDQDNTPCLYMWARPWRIVLSYVVTVLNTGYRLIPRYVVFLSPLSPHLVNRSLKSYVRTSSMSPESATTYRAVSVPTPSWPTAETQCPDESTQRITGLPKLRQAFKCQSAELGFFS